MSLKATTQNQGNPSRRHFEQDVQFAPFEVIDAGDGKVAVNEGVVIYGASSIYCDDSMFTSSAKPQDLLGGDVNESKFLSVEKGDYVIILLQYAEAGKPKAQLKAVKPAQLSTDEYKRKENRVIKLALIKDVKDYDGAKYLDIKNLYVNNVITEMDNWHAFAPVIWPVEKDVTAGGGGDTQTTDSWKCVFVPGSLYVPSTMDESKFFEVNGSSMIDLPIVDVKKGDVYYLTYEIDKTWKIKGTPKFTKSPGDKERQHVVPEGPECESSSGSDDPCKPVEGFYKLKVLEFIDKGGSLGVKQYWRSDVVLSNWERCPSVCDSDDSSDSNAGGSDSSDSSGSPPDSSSSEDPSSEDPSSDDSSDDDDDNPHGTGACWVELEVEGACYGVAFGPGYGGGITETDGGLCFNNNDLRACFLVEDFSDGSPDGPGGFAKVLATAYATPGELADCTICSDGGRRPQATLVVQIGPYKGKKYIDLTVGGDVSVCGIVPAGPCGGIAAIAYLEANAVVANQKPECRASELYDEASTIITFPGIGYEVPDDPYTTDPNENEYQLVCPECNTTPNPPGP